MSGLAVLSGISQGLNQASNTMIQIMAAKYKMQQDQKTQAEENKFKTKQLDLMERKYTDEINQNQAKADMVQNILAGKQQLPENASFSYEGLTLKAPENQTITPYQQKSLDLRQKEIDSNKYSNEFSFNQKRWNEATKLANLKMPFDQYMGKVKRQPTVEEIQAELPNVDKYIMGQQQAMQPQFEQQQPSAPNYNYQAEQVNNEQNSLKLEADSLYNELISQGLSEDEAYFKIYDIMKSKGKLR